MSKIRGKKILVVDNELGPRETIRLVLEKEGAVVQTAEDGYEALKILETNSFDLITSCIPMDGINGRDLCRLIQLRGITTPVVIITTMIPINREIEGVVDFIAKPFDMYDLQRRVEKALDCTSEKNRSNFNLLKTVKALFIKTELSIETYRRLHYEKNNSNYVNRRHINRRWRISIICLANKNLFWLYSCFKW